MNYFCIYFCLYPLQSMSVYWIWLILRRRAGEGLRRASGHAKETPRDRAESTAPNITGCIFHSDVVGHNIAHPACSYRGTLPLPLCTSHY